MKIIVLRFLKITTRKKIYSSEESSKDVSEVDIVIDDPHLHDILESLNYLVFFVCLILHYFN